MAAFPEPENDSQLPRVDLPSCLLAEAEQKGLKHAAELSENVAADDCIHCCLAECGMAVAATPLGPRVLTSNLNPPTGASHGTVRPTPWSAGAMRRGSRRTGWRRCWAEWRHAT